MDVRVGLLKKAEHWRIDAFELWCWRRLLEFLDCKEIQLVNSKGNQSWIVIGRTDSEAEIQYFGHLMRRTDSFEFEKTWCQERLKVGEKGDNRGWDGWMASLTQWTWVRVNSGSWWWTGKPGVLQSTGSQIVRHNWATELTIN